MTCRILCLLLFLSLTALPAAAEKPARPNVVFLVIDDQNDWVGYLGGHPLAQTPQLDKLAARGTAFLNAHCNAPLCNPSRTSVMLGLRPSSTGVYGLSPWFRSVAALKDRVTLAQHFKAQGYTTMTAGKVFHGGVGGPAKRAAEFDIWGPDASIGPRPEKKLIGPTPMGNNPLMDWGTFPHRDEDKGDHKVASWAMGQIRSAPRDKPFFLAAGFSLPHVPCYITPKWYDLFPDDDTVLPKILVDDRADVPAFAWRLHWQLPEPRLKWLKDNNQWRNLARSYLASTAFVDAQIGRVLDALEESGQAANTVVVVWSDHGYHLGEKGISGKNTLWERSTHIPLVFAGPGVSPGGRVSSPAELLDLYPTLAELCGLPPRDDLEGLSLVPQLRNADAPRTHPAITTHNQGNHSVRTERWRYLHYADGTEELYDLRGDPREWANLAGKPESAAVLAEHRKWLPSKDLPPVPGSASRVLIHNMETGVSIWEGQEIRPGDPVPE